jgi:uncharacterized protein YggU (UPF0235/DUF167 family)
MPRPSPPALAIDRSEARLAFWIHVTPRARKPGVGGLHGDALRVSVRAAPVAGAANAECAQLLAGALGVRSASVNLAAAAKGRRKRVSVEGDPDPLEARLLALAARARVG